MQNVALVVCLKIPDVTALTAAEALRRSLNYQQLRSLHRAEYYGLALRVESPDQATALATELAEQTLLFVNLNKEQYSLHSGPPSVGQARPGCQLVQVLVTTPDDPAEARLLATLQGPSGYADQVADLTRGVLWTLELAVDDPAEARRLAREIAAATSLEQGLLANPHCQKIEIW